MIGVSILFGLFTLFYAGYLAVKAVYFRKLRSFNPLSVWPSVSVIIPVRNEADRIGECLEDILKTDYEGEWEVLVVDDHSDDNTVEIVEGIGKNHPRIQLLHLGDEVENSYKKAALDLAIGTASHEIILTTDGDCRFHPGWIRAIMAGFSPETGMVSGPVALTATNLFEKMQALEFAGLIGVGAASIAAGRPNLCNGANLAFRKATFREVGGYTGIDHIASGDDELLMHKIAQSGNWQIRFCNHPEAVVRTPAQPDWQSFKNQRIRWVSKSTHYRDIRITLTLVISWLAMLAFPVWFIAGFFNPVHWLFLGGGLLLKMLSEGAVLLPVTRLLDQARWLKYIPLEQPLHILYVIWVGIAGNLGGYSWKGRRVK